MGCDLRCVLGRLVWKHCVGEAGGREIEDSELLPSELLVKWKAIKQKREAITVGHGLLYQIF